MDFLKKAAALIEKEVKKEEARKAEARNTRNRSGARSRSPVRNRSAEQITTHIPKEKLLAAQFMQDIGFGDAAAKIYEAAGAADLAVQARESTVSSNDLLGQNGKVTRFVEDAGLGIFTAPFHKFAGHHARADEAMETSKQLFLEIENEGDVAAALKEKMLGKNGRLVQAASGIEGGEVTAMLLHAQSGNYFHALRLWAGDRVVTLSVGFSVEVHLEHASPLRPAFVRLVPSLDASSSASVCKPLGELLFDQLLPRFGGDALALLLPTAEKKIAERVAVDSGAVTLREAIPIRMRSVPGMIQEQIATLNLPVAEQEDRRATPLLGGQVSNYIEMHLDLAGKTLSQKQLEAYWAELPKVDGILEQADQVQRLAIPLLGGQVVSFAEMCLHLAGQELSDDQLEAHWAELARVEEMSIPELRKNKLLARLVLQEQIVIPDETLTAVMATVDDIRVRHLTGSCVCERMTPAAAVVPSMKSIPSLFSKIGMEWSVANFVLLVAMLLGGALSSVGFHLCWCCAVAYVVALMSDFATISLIKNSQQNAEAWKIEQGLENTGALVVEINNAEIKALVKEVQQVSMFRPECLVGATLIVLMLALHVVLLLPLSTCALLCLWPAVMAFLVPAPPALLEGWMKVLAFLLMVASSIAPQKFGLGILSIFLDTPMAVQRLANQPTLRFMACLPEMKPGFQCALLLDLSGDQMTLSLVMPNSSVDAQILAATEAAKAMPILAMLQDMDNLDACLLESAFVSDCNVHLTWEAENVVTLKANAEVKLTYKE